ncbi:collagen-binding protein [Bacteroidia bacterium]|nr:collagen-binding protein [Bacteroidia bacterium]
MDKVDNEPIIAGSVNLLQRKDSISITGAISDAGGRFSIKNVKEGNYILKITYLGYNTLTKNIGVKANEDVNMGRIFLETNDVLLQEMVVEGKRPEVVVKNDTIEYDAGSYKVTENAAVEELLKKMPGIEVDKDGKITANGKEIKKIMLDGKEFFTDDPQVASKNLPATMVNKVQVVDRKSDMARMTGFDDGEEETILNLMIRPGMKKGTMGNALLGGGADVPASHDMRYQGAAFVNHMKDDDRYTLILGTNNNNNMGAADLGAGRFGGMRMRRGSGNGGGIAESNMVMLNVNKQFSPAFSLNGDVRYNGSDRSAQNLTEQWISSQFDKTLTNNNYGSNSVAANLNIEWKPDTLNSLIFKPQFGMNGSNSTETGSLYKGKTSEADSDLLDDLYNAYSGSRSKGRGFNFGGTLDYARKFDKPGRVFSISLRGNLNNSYSYENDSTKYDRHPFTNIVDFQRRYENDDRANSYRATISWVEPLGNNNFLQALYRYSYNNTKSLNTTYDVDYESNPDLYLALLNDSLSRSTLRHSTGQRFGLSFKAVREKYNYTIGLNVDPEKSINETWQASLNTNPFTYGDDIRLPNILGDSLISSIPQNNIYFSPTLNFNYIFGQRTNLRIDYEGETTQPSSNQLRDYVDMSNASNWVKGNPNLQPGYRNSLRARFQKYVPETQLMYNLSLNGGFSINDITSVTQMQDSVRLTEYENINGNWNVNTRGMFNLPLKNKRFTVNSFFNASYNNRNSYVYENQEKRTNRQNTLSGMLRANINYRSDLFEVGLGAFTNYNDIVNSIRPQNDLTTVSYGFSVNTMWYLPYNWTLESDLNYTTRNGFKEGLNTPETMWNAAVTKQLFNKKFGTGSLKLQIFDILQDRKFITSSAIDNGTRISEDLLVIPSYVMCSFIYKFTVFPKASSATEDDFRPRWGGGGGRPEGPPPGVPRMF